jgi:tRNA A-37 threonylcarbamoyl transferase component Bud32
MKVVINPKYSHLSEYIHNLPIQCYTKDTIIRDNRNILRKDTVDGVAMVIKQYKKPSMFNRIMYTFFRKSKARRSYEYAFRLKELGVGTAKPIAYIEEKKHGLFHTGYFVSKYVPCPLMSDLGKYEPATQKEVMESFIRFTVDLHQKGVLHYDYNLSNIMFYKEQDGYQFKLLDINRMRFNTYSKRKCMRALRTMTLQLPYFVAVLEQYGDLRGWNSELFCGALLMKRGYKNIRVRFKHKLKAIIGLA